MPSKKPPTPSLPPPFHPQQFSSVSTTKQQSIRSSSTKTTTNTLDTPLTPLHNSDYWVGISVRSGAPCTAVFQVTKVRIHSQNSEPQTRFRASMLPPPRSGSKCRHEPNSFDVGNRNFHSPTPPLPFQLIYTMLKGQIHRPFGEFSATDALPTHIRTKRRIPVHVGKTYTHLTTSYATAPSLHNSVLRCSSPPPVISNPFLSSPTQQTG